MSLNNYVCFSFYNSWNSLVKTIGCGGYMFFDEYKFKWTRGSVYTI